MKTTMILYTIYNIVSCLSPACVLPESCLSYKLMTPQFNPHHYQILINLIVPFRGGDQRWQQSLVSATC